MRCIWAVCQVLCRKMCRMRCIIRVPGLENAKIVRNAYAIEYDCINPRQLKPTLEFKKIRRTYSAEDSLMEVQDMRRQQHRD